MTKKTTKIKNDKTKAALAKKRAKDAADKKLVAAQKTAEGKLPAFAKVINVRLEKANKLDDNAADHRLAAAIELDKAKTQCSAAGVKFPDWCAENVEQSYDTVRKLAVIGGAEDPKLALEDMRGKNKDANKKLRDKKKAKSKVNPNPVNRDGIEPEELVEQGFDALDDGKVEEIIREQAEELGLSVVSRDAKDAMAELKELFEELDEKEQKKFYTWVAAQMFDAEGEKPEEKPTRSGRQRRTRKAA